MSKKINISEIQPDQLNSACLIWIYKFARVLRAQKGINTDIEDRNVIKQIVNQAHKKDNPDLLRLYQSLKHEIKRLVNSDQFDQRSLSKLIVSSDTCSKSNNRIP